MWSEAVMFLLEFLAALCAVAVCGPCLLACARRLLLGDELLQRTPTVVREADVLGCDEPACPYYKKNVKYLMVPARRRTYGSPTRQCS
uniref:Secreted protein n=1 Tax=Heliothis virescens TaxID=7102 RepID=A0A2A4J418_HELVI